MSVSLIAPSTSKTASLDPLPAAQSDFGPLAIGPRPKLASGRSGNAQIAHHASVLMLEDVAVVAKISDDHRIDEGILTFASPGVLVFGSRNGISTLSRTPTLSSGLPGTDCMRNSS